MSHNLTAREQCKPHFFVDKNGHAIEINYGFLFFFGLMPKKTYDLMCS